MWVYVWVWVGGWEGVGVGGWDTHGMRHGVESITISTLSGLCISCVCLQLIRSQPGLYAGVKPINCVFRVCT